MKHKSLLSRMKMGKEILKFVDIEIKKKNLLIIVLFFENIEMLRKY